MVRRYALLSGIQSGIGKSTVDDGVIMAKLETVFTGEFLEGYCTAGEAHQIDVLLRSTPWANELGRLLGVEDA